MAEGWAKIYGLRKIVNSANAESTRRDALKVVGATVSDDGTRTVLTISPSSAVATQYSNATRPAATGFTAGQSIWNTDDKAFNYSDGTSWYDALGDLT